jgi:glycerol-3-phosphate dehydrogenase subunit C
VNYNKPDTGMAARAVLNHIGVETRAAYPGCCGMPFLEQGELDRVAAQALKVSRELCALIDEGYDIVHADRVVRIDAEIRMAADPAGQ